MYVSSCSSKYIFITVPSINFTLIIHPHGQASLARIFKTWFDFYLTSESTMIYISKVSIIASKLAMLFHFYFLFSHEISSSVILITYTKMILKHWKVFFVLENQLSDVMKVTVVTLDWMQRKTSFIWFKWATEISYFT